jgi:hypothetical protein
MVKSRGRKIEARGGTRGQRAEGVGDYRQATG